MNADAGRRFVEEALDVVELPFERLHGREAPTQFDVGVRSLGPPLGGIDAVAHEQNRDTLRRGRSRRRLGAPDGQRLQPRQRHHHPGTAQEAAPRQFTRVSLERTDHHAHGPDAFDELGVARFVRNCRLVTMS